MKSDFDWDSLTLWLEVTHLPEGTYEGHPGDIRCQSM